MLKKDNSKMIISNNLLLMPILMKFLIHVTIFMNLVEKIMDVHS